MPLYVERRLLDEIFQHAGQAFPHECCGILIGTEDGEARRVRKIIMADNIAEGDRTRSYQVDWHTLLATVKDARDSDQPIIGFYHSHPDETTEPSQRDCDEAWIDYLYLIVAVRSNTPDRVRCWRKAEGSDFMVEEPVVVESHNPNPV